MNVKNDSTRTANDATRTCVVSATTVMMISDKIDMKDGIQAKAQANKHLSELLMHQIEQMVGFTRGKAGSLSDTRDFTFYDRQIDALQWLVAEVWETAENLAGQLDDLSNGIVELSNAEYATRPPKQAEVRVAA